MWGLFLIHGLLPRALDRHPPRLLPQVPSHRSLLSPLPTAPLHPSHPLPCCPEPWPPTGQKHSLHPEAGGPVLSSQVTALLTPVPHTADRWVVWHPQVYYEVLSAYNTLPTPLHPPRLCFIKQGQFRCHLLLEACSDFTMPWNPLTPPALDRACPGAVTPALPLLVPFCLSLWPAFLLHLAP